MLAVTHLTTLEVAIGEVHLVGALPQGGIRRVIAITGGTMAGPVLAGRVLPGGADWNTTRPDGRADVWARYTVETSDGVAIGIVNRGVVTGEEGSPRAVTSVTLEAPQGRYAWLNDTVVVGTLRALSEDSGVRIDLYQVSDPT